MGDERITTYTSYYFTKYQEVYPNPPIWSGKEAKLLQGVIKSFDQRKIDISTLNGCIDRFMKDGGYAKQNAHAFHIFAKNPDKYFELIPIVEKAKEMFGITKKKVEEIYTVLDHDDESLLKQMATIYPCNEEGCRRWVKGQRYVLEYIQPKEGSKANNHWLKMGKLAKVYFGHEMVVRLWREKEESKEAHTMRVKEEAKKVLTQEKK